MAEKAPNAPGESSASAAEGIANLHLDEVTGEHVSKSELKKRIKAREKVHTTPLDNLHEN